MICRQKKNKFNVSKSKFVMLQGQESCKEKELEHALKLKDNKIETQTSDYNSISIYN